MSMILTAKKWFQNLFHILADDAKAEIVQYAGPAIEFLKANGGVAALTLAETFLSGVATGTPWPAMIAAFMTQAEQAGIKLAEGAAGAVLNYAQTNMIAKGTLPVPANSNTPAPVQAAS